ncbi:MAG: hypothetical protein DME26_13075, partial [Verrucomicrobia bacterium]
MTLAFYKYEIMRCHILFALSLAVAIVSGCRSVPAERLADRSAPAFWKSRVEDAEEAVRQVKNGTVSVLARTPGGRRIYLVAYGERQDLHGTANYSSACGGNDPASYARKDGTQ